LTDVGLDRIEHLGQRCARASVRPNILYKFHVVQMKEINGFSLPGGHIYITSALIKLANDNELASVLCHEVGHIAARHSLKTLKKRQEYNDIAKSIGEITGIAGDIGRELGEAIGQMAGEGILTFHSQDEEREADFLGVRDMTKAGFDAQGMITMFQKLQRIENQSPDLLGSLFSDHPDVQERIDNTRYEIARMTEVRTARVSGRLLSAGALPLTVGLLPRRQPKKTISAGTSRTKFRSAVFTPN
jgi:predicted Zn-dependent protease